MSLQPFRDAPSVEPPVTLAVRRGMSPARPVLAVAAAVAVFVLTKPHSLPLALFAAAFIACAGRFFRFEAKLDADRHELHVDRSLLGALRTRTTTDLTPFTGAEVAGSALADPTRRFAFRRSDDFVVMLVNERGERHYLEGWSGSARDTKTLARRIDEALHPEHVMLTAPTSAPEAVISCRAGYEYGFMVLLVVSVALFVGFAVAQVGPWPTLFPLLLLPAVVARAFPRRQLLLYASEGQVALVTSYLGLFPDTQRVALARVQRAVIDQQTVNRAAVLLLDDGHHIPLTVYSNASFGLDGFVARINAALGKA